MSQSFTHPFPPVYACLAPLLKESATAHTTSPCGKEATGLAPRGMPGLFRASSGKGTGWGGPPHVW